MLLAAVLIFSVKGFTVYGQDTNSIKALLYKAMELQYSDLDSAAFLAKKGYSLSLKANYTRGIAASFMRFGNIHDVKGQMDSAIQYYRLALSIRWKEKDITGQANTLSEIGFHFRQQGHKDSAFYYFFEAARLYGLAGDSIDLGLAFTELSESSLNYGNRKQALLYLDKSAGIFRRFHDVENMAILYSKYGIIYYDNSEYRTALTYFLKSQHINDSLNNATYLAKDYGYLGLCYDGLGDHKLARLNYQESLNRFTSLNMENDRAEVLYNIGIHFYNLNKPDSCIYYLELGKTTLRNSKVGGMKLKLFNSLSDSYALKGNYVKAYEYHVLCSNLNDSLLDSEKVKQIAEMQTKYESEKKDQQIVILDSQNKAKTAQRNVLLVGSALLFVLLLASGIYFMQRNRLAKKNELIAQEKISGLLKEQEIKSYNAMIEGQEDERKRIATDLHDRLGSMLSTVKLLFGSLDEKIDKNQAENMNQYNKANNLLDEAVLEVRRISHNLSTGMVISFGLVGALEELCESIDNSKLIKCKLLCFGMEARLDQQTEIGIFRIVQELVNNVLKHAKAEKITIQLNRTEGSLNVTVEDDGVGFNVEEKKKNGGLGLANITARTAKLNGVFSVDSKPGRGTISIIEIPLKESI